ncbi:MULTISPECIES: transaldolase [Microbacterium]|uniref:transaldolase n=2 Tax=Microbacteriaceae TaxID=85023 RepID=UPI0006F6F8BA|nr:MULTISPECIES: transaldolase [unclassified Microbacterium]MBN9197553.1 transaldolase [Microbacterium ginsengisoli]MCK9919930.1 transaldolase [Microbacteriaceae bacterium K1510]KQS01610.1 transaldolase [Microbacterium sp. Leaf347]ODU77762.1 MAG: transaldolase [Microbacterium sp. SCN 71-21]OJU79507.1 MAG: transaldolase [Microbacterium sp. 71-23]
MSTPTAALAAAGVSIWLDDLSRERIESGELAELVRTRNVTGVTTNPSIFQAAITRGAGYGPALAREAAAAASVDEAILRITTDDVRDACDVLREVYDATGGVDGRVSIEVSPELAHDTEGTIAQAFALHAAVARPNVLIKIPATRAGLPAITAVVAAGVSVNVTLIFSLERYTEVIDAYLAGLEQARANRLDLTTIHSVASFFISRVDTEVDARLAAIGTDAALALRGQAALANARLAYNLYEQRFEEPRVRALLAAGANRQRPLWASTGVKDPSFPDTRYVTELVARGTVNTMPAATLEATFDHAIITGDTVTARDADARAVLDALAAAGVDFGDVTRLLEERGVAAFVDSWADLTSTVAAALAPALTH